jgi:hypothetical protein
LFTSGLSSLAGRSAAFTRRACFAGRPVFTRRPVGLTGCRHGACGRSQRFVRDV